MSEARLAEMVHAKLAVHLGPNVAKMTLDGFLRRNGLGGREAMTAAHLPALVAEIRPMLNVMIGRGPTESVLSEIERGITSG